MKPINEENQQEEKCIQILDEQTLLFNNPLSKSDVSDKPFVFDQIIEGNSQEGLFDSCFKGKIKKFFEGYNVTILTYGQSNSGKTHTIIGNWKEQESKGVLPRSIDLLFQLLDSQSASVLSTVSVQILEIYADKITDLIQWENDVQIVQQGDQDQFVNLAEIFIPSKGEIWSVLEQAL